MACHFVSLFPVFEILSVSFYTIIAYLRQRERSVEAGLKYLILAAASSAFVATVSKGAMFALLFRFYFLLDGKSYPSVYTSFWVIAAASMFIGNLMALRQRNMKRLLACSSIAYMGYLLAGFTAGGKMAAEASIFYIATYMITIMSAFGVVTILSEKDHDADSPDDYQGLFWRRPLLAAAFTVMLLSLAEGLRRNRLPGGIISRIFA